MGTAASCAWFGVRANAICPTAYGRMSAYRPATHGAQPVDQEMSESRTPDTNAPLVVALASPRAVGITGQLFRIMGHDIMVIAAPQVEAEFHSDQNWTADEVSRQLSGYFSVPRQGFGWPVAEDVKAQFPTMSQ
jgi:hypothetical protein